MLNVIVFFSVSRGPGQIPLTRVYSSIASLPHCAPLRLPPFLFLFLFFFLGAQTFVFLASIASRCPIEALMKISTFRAVSRALLWPLFLFLPLFSFSIFPCVQEFLFLLKKYFKVLVFCFSACFFFFSSFLFFFSPLGHKTSFEPQSEVLNCRVFGISSRSHLLNHSCTSVP